MRLLLLVLGFALGVAATLAYATFASRSYEPVAAPLEPHPQLSVTLGEPLVAEIIQRSIAEAPGAGARPTLQVTLRDDAIAIEATVDVLGQRASGTALLRPVIDRGRIRIEVGETTLGALQLPPLEAMLERQINARIGSLLAGMPVTFTGARIDRTRGLTVTCRVEVASLEVGALR